MFVIHTSHESGRDNVDGVRPNYPVCGYLGFYPDGGLPYGHPAKNTVRNESTVPIGVSTALPQLKLPLDTASFLDSSKANPHHKDYDYPAP